MWVRLYGRCGCVCLHTSHHTAEDVCAGGAVWRCVGRWFSVKSCGAMWKEELCEELCQELCWTVVLCGEVCEAVECGEMCGPWYYAERCVKRCGHRPNSSPQSNTVPHTSSYSTTFPTHFSTTPRTHSQRSAHLSTIQHHYRSTRPAPPHHHPFSPSIPLAHTALRTAPLSTQHQHIPLRTPPLAHTSPHTTTHTSP